MREIVFRGKRFDNNEWVEGGFYLEPYTDNAYIIAWNSMGMGFIEYILVCSDSVGQYTGLKDKNGKRIFEGDILSCPNGQCPTCRVIFNKFCAAFQLMESDGYTDFFLCSINHSKMEIIGNIHDNPELIAEEKNG